LQTLLSPNLPPVQAFPAWKRKNRRPRISLAGGGSNSILWGSKPRTALQSVLRRVHCPPYLLQKSVTHDAQTLNIGFAFFFSTQM